MNVKTKLFALAGMPVLSLFAAVALADVSGPPDESDNATGFFYDDEIKNSRQCFSSEATFFKNAFPSLTNGSERGSETIDFNVDGKIVSMTVTWETDNSFGFEIFGGWANRVGVTVDQTHFVYEYSGPAVGIEDPANVFTDTRLNYYGGAIADDVNHLDLCLVALDTEDPVVTITSPSNGDSVSGIESRIIATITDNEGLETVTASVDGVPPNDGQTIPVTLVSGPVNNVYTWTFNASALDVGDYDITVSATDTSILENTATDSITVTVVRTLQDCLEGPDGVPPGTDPNAGGCDLTGFLLLEYPQAAGQAGNLPVAQAAIPAWPAARSSSCGSDDFPLVAQDPRVSLDGTTVNLDMEYDLSLLFNIQGHYNEFHGGETAPPVFLRADTVGSPCLALLHQDAPAFSLLSGIEELQNGGVYTVTQRPEDVPGMYDGLDRITAPLSIDQPDLQLVEQATLQTDLLELLVEGAASPFTSEVFNASRTRGFDGTFFPLNTREVCLSLDPALSPDAADGGAAYFEAVLQCKTDLAVEYFNNMEQALLNAAPNLISPALNTLLTPLNKARSMVKVGRWNKANVDLRAFEKEVTEADWNVTDANDPGNLIMRIDNLFFRIEQLDWAEANLP